MNKESGVWVGSLLQEIYLEIGRTRLLKYFIYYIFSAVGGTVWVLCQDV